MELSGKTGLEILYKAERRNDALVIRLEEKGSRRILYLDRLKALAKPVDHEALSLLVKIQMAASRNSETASYQQVIIPAAYRSEVLKALLKTGRLSGDLPCIKPPEPPLQVFPKLVLQDASGLFANLIMDYGIAEIPFEDFSPKILGRPRLVQEEKQWEKDLLEAGFQKKPVAGSQNYCPQDKVKEALSLLLQVGCKIWDRQSRRVRAQTDLSIEIKEEGNSITVRTTARFGEESVPLLSNMQMWAILSDHSVGLLDQKPHLEGIWEGEKLRLRKGQIGALFPFLEEASWDPDLKALAVGLKDGAFLEPAHLKELFQGTLLPYQQKGVDWLSFLHRYGLGALLADEMGLGKTVQVLAFLSRLPSVAPILIVAPTSLLFNWRSEILKFLPSAHNITLISYAQLRAHSFEDMYDTIILDESNAIKTASTQTARAACRLKAKFKVCLSGTPVENCSDELLSQFHFLMPHLIEKSDLKQKVRPFILRRRKEEVQMDLPEKIEQTVWVDLDPEQEALYQSYRQGFHETHREILETILRLRQICCDPRLVGSDASSGKFSQLLSDLEEVLSQNRKVIVFSQFTSILQLVRKNYPEALYLDGATPAKERGKIVELFQTDPSKQLFLLSLKAGGVGLNLTAADYVFLFDPWWNDAVERQAVDRAHRMGRKNTVIARRYLTVGTIEEKMLRLKEKKQATADDLLEEGGFSKEDLLFLLER